MVTFKQKNISFLEINGSKFYAIFFGLDSKNDFKENLESIKKEYKKAKHYVYAYRCVDGSKSTDDNEPKGTAGRPLLELLYKKDLMNVAIVVVRYFGGTKLGASRLLRTYVNVAAKAMEGQEFKEFLEEK